MKLSVRSGRLLAGCMVTFLLAVSVAYGGSAVKTKVSTGWVSENSGAVKIIDLRLRDYAKGHIPGAMQMQWGQEVYSQGEEFMLPPNLVETKRVFTKMGLTPADHIVLYDGDAGMDQVMRLYWALKYWNFQKVSIIEGGLALWAKENRPLAYEAQQVSHASSLEPGHATEPKL